MDETRACQMSHTRPVQAVIYRFLKIPISLPFQIFPSYARNFSPHTLSTDDSLTPSSCTSRAWTASLGLRKCLKRFTREAPIGTFIGTTAEEYVLNYVYSRGFVGLICLTYETLELPDFDAF